ncbi:MAG: hypothetical protein KJ606_07600 [Chloroflexi bacterium]|jgi:hypothetical protein|nr:hypothetical protein [Chloroflexota bacterium]
MKHTIARISLVAGKIQPNHVRLAWMVLALALFVIGAGAPESGGSVGE